VKNYKINKGFVVQKLDKKTVIFDGDKSTLYTFNNTASLILNKLKKGRSQKEIIDYLVKKYRVPEKKVEKDVTEITDNLIRMKIFIKKTHKT
jgi:hypothetical protein